MGFLVDKWHRIGARLYLALGFAVLLTLVSSAVGVYYFELSGDLNDRVRSESVPVLEASWDAAREIERLQVLGVGLLTEPDSGTGDLASSSIANSLERLEKALSRVSGVEALAADAGAVQDAAYGMAEIMDDLALNRVALSAVDQTAADLKVRLDELSPDGGPSVTALSVLKQALAAEDQSTLQGLFEEFADLYEAGLEPSVATLGEDEQGVFAVRGELLALRDRSRDLAAAFNHASAVAEESVSTLLTKSQAESSKAVDLAVSSFDQGRLLLTGISVISVVVATLAAWLWVGNGMVRRLSRLSDRMRNMADGDLETTVPEVGRDEIGELAEALEVFRQQALEVQRLNLVEKLYEDLRVANDELQRMQARLVASEKLAALGELVSGVAHEMANPLNFVKNFSEGSLEMYEELSDMLERYRDAMTEDDESLLDDISQEMSDSLKSVAFNGGRALAIVERMRGLGVLGSEPVLADLNPILRQAAQTASEAVEAESEGFSVQPVLDLDASIGQVPLVESDFGEAVMNLVTNACHAMQQKQQEAGGNYEPALSVSSRLVDDLVEVRVRDNGSGIADDVLPRIFNPFFSTRAGAIGAGLGLPIAADVVRRLGGDLSVDTAYGEFAEFTISLPATAAGVSSTS